MWSSVFSSPYQPLDRNKKQIRLVTLKPNEKWYAKPECELSTVSLSDKPAYTAISYVWGKNLWRTSIFLNGQSFKITWNLYCGLLRLRNDRRPWTFWIDAICINQDDKRERASQVQLMREIYSNAASTVVYLGEHFTSILAMKLLSDFPSDGDHQRMLELGHSVKLTKHWRALEAMISNEY